MTALLQVSGYVRRQSAKSDEKRPRFTPEQIATASQMREELRFDRDVYSQSMWHWHKSFRES